MLAFWGLVWLVGCVLLLGCLGLVCFVCLIWGLGLVFTFCLIGFFFDWGFVCVLFFCWCLFCYNLILFPWKRNFLRLLLRSRKCVIFWPFLSQPTLRCRWLLVWLACRSWRDVWKNRYGVQNMPQIKLLCWIMTSMNEDSPSERVQHNADWCVKHTVFAVSLNIRFN